MDWKRLSRFAAPTVRIGISLVFLWFGLNQLLDTSSWVAWLPLWTLELPLRPLLFIQMNGFFETLFGLLLLVGKWTRPVACLLALHLFVIALSLGYNDIMIRDLGLALATLSIAFQGPDQFCLDKKK